MIAAGHHRATGLVQLWAAYAAQRVLLDDPAAVARVWRAFGFSHLHVGTRRGGHEREARAPGANCCARRWHIPDWRGIRSAERVDSLLAQGASA